MNPLRQRAEQKLSRSPYTNSRSQQQKARKPSKNNPRAGIQNIQLGASKYLNPVGSSYAASGSISNRRSSTPNYIHSAASSYAATGQDVNPVIKNRVGRQGAKAAAMAAADTKPQGIMKTDDDRVAESKQKKDNSIDALFDREETGDMLSDFEKYSADNLGGMSAYDMQSGAGFDDTQSYIDAWRNMASDPTMSKYFQGNLSDTRKKMRESGNETLINAEKAMKDDSDALDYWLNSTMGGVLDIDTSAIGTPMTYDEMLSDPSQFVRYFGNNADMINELYNGAAYDGYGPSFDMNDTNADKILNAYASDPSLMAEQMKYMSAMNLLGSLGDDQEENVKSLLDMGFTGDEINSLVDLGRMEFGRGDDYDMEFGDMPENLVFSEIDPQFWDTSIKKGYSSVPGTALPVHGLESIMGNKLGLGHKYQPGVMKAYEAYRSEDE